MQATTKYIAQLFLAGMVCLVSCKKLDLTPPSQLSTTIFWKTAGDADLALTGLYNTLYANDGTVDQNAPYWWTVLATMPIASIAWVDRKMR